MKTEDMLRLAADLERFCPRESASGLLRDAESELSVEELEDVAAAGARPDYARFLALLREREDRP